MKLTHFFGGGGGRSNQCPCFESVDSKRSEQVLIKEQAYPGSGLMLLTKNKRVH